MGLVFFFTQNPLLAQSETSGREKPYRATATKTHNIQHTILKVDFDFENEKLHGEEFLTLSPHFYATDSVSLNAKSMLIHEVSIDKKLKKIPLKYEYRNNILNIKLDKTYQKNENYTLYIKYTAQPNLVENKKTAAISDDKGLYFINSKGKLPHLPTQIWTQGETESSSVWFPTIDKPNQKSTQEIYMSVPENMVTLSNGILKSQKKIANNKRTDHWVMDKKHAPYLFFMAVGDFEVIKDSWNGIVVDYYVEKKYAPFARQTFGMTPKMLDFYSKKFKYPFPWAKYSQIVGRNFVSGAMENTTAVIHAENAYQTDEDLNDENQWEAVIAHELVHHWFGDLVTTESWANLTINESFANYCEYLWFEHQYGKDLADHHLMVNTGQYIHAPQDFQKNLVRFNYHSREDMFDRVSYNKGGAILHMLRKYLGDEAFFEGIYDFLKTHEYSTAEAHQLRLSFEKISGKDLNWFFNQWYFSNGNPILNYTTQFDPMKKEIKIHLSQKEFQPFEFPLEIDIFEGTKKQRVKVWVEAKEENIFSFPVSKNPSLINLNPEGILLSKINEDKTPEQLFTQFTQSQDYFAQYKALENALEKDKNNAWTHKILLSALKHHSYKIRVKALENISIVEEKNAKIFQSEIEKIAQNDKSSLVKGMALFVLAQSKNPKFLKLFEKNISAPSTAMKSASFLGIANLSPEKIKNFSEKIDLTHAPTPITEHLIPIIVKNKLEKHAKDIAGTCAFYPFIQYNSPDLGDSAKEGFFWIMQNDFPQAVENITKNLVQVKKEIPAGTENVFKEILKIGLDEKMKTLKNSPDNHSLLHQVELLNQALKVYQN